MITIEIRTICNVEITTKKTFRTTTGETISTKQALQLKLTL